MGPARRSSLGAPGPSVEGISPAQRFETPTAAWAFRCLSQKSRIAL